MLPVLNRVNDLASHVLCSNEKVCVVWLEAFFSQLASCMAEKSRATVHVRDFNVFDSHNLCRKEAIVPFQDTEPTRSFS